MISQAAIIKYALRTCGNPDLKIKETLRQESACMRRSRMIFITCRRAVEHRPKKCCLLILPLILIEKLFFTYFGIFMILDTKN